MNLIGATKCRRGHTEGSVINTQTFQCSGAVRLSPSLTGLHCNQVMSRGGEAAEDLTGSNCLGFKGKGELKTIPLMLVVEVPLAVIP